MRRAVLVDAVRTPLGVRNGGLARWHPADLLAHVLSALSARIGLDPARVDEVVVGCATPTGRQALNVGRNAVLAAGWPETVPASTVDRQGASSAQAIHFAVHGVLAGAFDVVVAAGVEVMSSTPPGAALRPGWSPFGPGVLARYRSAGGLVPPGVAAERVAEGWSLSRVELDAYAAESHRRAAVAARNGGFDAETVPVPARPGGGNEGDVVEVVRHDENVDPGVTAEGLAQLKPTFEPGGTVTAGNAAPAADGAAAVVVAEEAVAERLGMAPLARFGETAGAGADPLDALTAGAAATTRLLERAGLGPADVDLFEVEECFASVALAWLRRHGADPHRVNSFGGAIALGHPVGCSGARLVATLAHGLARRAGRYGLATSAGAGGVGTATLLEAPG